MAHYVLLIHGDEQAWSAMTADDEVALANGHRDFVSAAGRAIVMGHELRPAGGATTLRPGVDGTPTPTDGPFAESSESIGGFYVVESDSLDDVVALASRLHETTVGHSGVEIREVVGA